MRTRERDDLLIIEAQSIRKDGSEVIRALGTVRETTAARVPRVVRVVGPPRTPLDLGAAHLLNSNDAGEGVQVRVGDPGVCLLDGLEERACVLQTSVGRVATLVLKADARAV